MGDFHSEGGVMLDREDIHAEFAEAAHRGERGEFFDGDSYSFRRLGSQKDAAFEQLCARLYARKWAAEERKRNPEKVRARLNAWRASNREHVRTLEKAQRDRRRVWLHLTCAECGCSYSPPKTKNVASKWCSKKCRNRRWGRDRKPRNRGLRNMKARELVLAALKSAPGSTSRQIADATGVKFGSAATLLCELVRAGVVQRTGWGANHRGLYEVTAS